MRGKRLTPAHPLVALALGALLAAPAAAGDGWIAQHGFAPRTVADQRLTLEQAIDKVQRAYDGRVLDAKDLGEEYRIKVLTRRGEVRVVHVDARTGAMR